MQWLTLMMLSIALIGCGGGGSGDGGRTTTDTPVTDNAETPDTETPDKSTPGDGSGNDSGDDNSGNDNSGNDNSGNDNSGNDNSGDDNSGNDNSGDDNSGNDNSGDDNSGDDNSGDDNSGDDNSGDDNSGDDNSGDDNSGDDNSGDDNSGDDNSGDDNSGDDNSEQVSQLSYSDAFQFLNQATFGATPSSVAELQRLGTDAWLNQQIAGQPDYISPHMETLKWRMCLYEVTDHPGDQDLGTPSVDNPTRAIRETPKDKHARHQAWWNAILRSDDQLRHRMALALSEILVVSDRGNETLDRQQTGLAHYYDTLLKHALGNYRDLLEDVTLHPAMGTYLSHARNAKADPSKNTRPDENYAREVMQLFTIGLYEMNLDGSYKRSNGELIPTYTQTDIEELARVFTGWIYDFRPNGFLKWWVSRYGGYQGQDVRLPMAAFEEEHDTDAKTLLGGSVNLPAGNTAQQDLDMALDALFQHPNVAPFISRQLIQRLVSSNPSPAYIQRVASVFENNGQGERGDLAAVAKAIVTDPEAMAASDSKLTQPMLRLARLWRIFPLTAPEREGWVWNVWQPDNRDVYCGQPGYEYFEIHPRLRLAGLQFDIGQAILRASSVFNFYTPDDRPTGPVSDAKMVAPEFALMGANQYLAMQNYFDRMLYLTTVPNAERQPHRRHLAYMNIEHIVQVANDTRALLDSIDLHLLGGTMSTELRGIVEDYINSQNYHDDLRGQRLKTQDALSLVVASPEFMLEGK
ncbi:hypothetical protein CHH28_10770 [Bacterioplanes sanyensis]|uniref:DUF1800 domain-containing protein n=1 Tax=Bacterioplanes sanyensis TaxID=1249553 RepID=A0A222FLN2_9GAMM|nr:DUF1800 domain-containing protein [Bacterioplanes sanyensis]ASP39133.1 hypothetical protein CHH28_10770 [Bacterioplanes sanyensis]